MSTHLEIHQGIAWLSINRPEKRNALNPEVVIELTEQLKKLKNDENVKILVLSGKGKNFCSGADLEYIQSLQNFSFEENLADSRQLASLFKELLLFPKPTIAMVFGSALAGGCGLAMACDTLIAEKDSVFGFTEVRIGFVPAIVSIIVRKKWGLHTALELLLSGNLYGADYLKNKGWINSIADGNDYLKQKTELFAKDLMTQNSMIAIQQTKELLWSLEKPSLDEALELASLANAKARQTDDCKKGIAKFLNKEKLVWD